MVPATGLEPVRCYSLEPESSASANSATRATSSLMADTIQALLCSRKLARASTQFSAPRATTTQRDRLALVCELEFPQKQNIGPTLKRVRHRRSPTYRNCKPLAETIMIIEFPLINTMFVDQSGDFDIIAAILRNFQELAFLEPFDCLKAFSRLFHAERGIRY